MAGSVEEADFGGRSPDATCACGQALDCCHTAHCPRCGITLEAA